MPGVANIEIEERVPVDSLEEHPENPRQGDVGAIATSIQEHGFYGTVVAQRSTRRVLAGNHRVRAAGALGITEVPVAWVDVDDAGARAILLADNRTGDLADYDRAALADLLRDLAAGPGLTGTGYDGDDLDLLLRDLSFEPRFVPTPVPLDLLSPHPRNYREHPPEQIAHIIASIEAHGFYRNVVAAKDGTILAGHGVVLAAREMGRRTVPVVRLDLDPFEPRALSILVADNEIQQFAVSDDRALTELLRDLAQTDGLLGTGFDEEQLAALVMVTRPASEIADKTDVGEWVGLPGFEAQSRYPEIHVKFEDEDDRARFAELIGMTVINKRTGLSWAIWWPEREREDLAAIKYEVER